ncbi:TylF/MycF/NovP-related O-methyltransferase [Tistrella sp. BH-R2-4]|uniref:TylF/MycF/NovP-related O-methyltransferase n=1 Tax=Tistrella arctica TaxID=3133430 RepID=A0ABU9YRI5_9PROT
MTDPATRYLDLLKSVLLNMTGLEAELRIATLAQCAAAGATPDPLLLRDIRIAQADRFEALAARRHEGRHIRADHAGMTAAYTMAGRLRLDHLQTCLERVTVDNVPGDLLEAGIWRGGCGIFMRGFLAVHGITDRLVWLADSFTGVPPPSHPVDAGVTLSDQASLLAIARPLVEDAFRRFDLWDDRVRLVEGLFADTLPGLPVERLAVLRLDGDLFTSTRDALQALYDRVMPGGYIIIDDYHALDSCRFATDAFRLVRGITDPLERVDWTCVAWRKS